MRELQHIDVADAYLLLELLTRQTVVETRLTRRSDRWRQAKAIVFGVRLSDVILDLQLACTVEYRGREMQSKDARGPAEMRFEDLTDVHTRWHAERIENDLDRRSIRQVRHIFLGKNAGDDALVAVTSG